MERLRRHHRNQIYVTPHDRSIATKNRKASKTRTHNPVGFFNILFYLINKMNDSDSDNEMPSEQPRHTTSSAARRRRRSNARQAWFTQQQNYQNSSSTTTDSEPTNSNSDSASSSSSRGRRHSDRSRNSSSTRSTTRNESQFMSESRTRGIISSIQRTQITELQPGMAK